MSPARLLKLLFPLALLHPLGAEPDNPDRLVLRFAEPASALDEGLPLGGGSLGAVVEDKPASVQLTVFPGLNWPLDDATAPAAVLPGPDRSSTLDPLGALGRLVLNIDLDPTIPHTFERRLALDEVLASVHYQQEDGLTIRREILVDAERGLIAAHLQTGDGSALPRIEAWLEPIHPGGELPSLSEAGGGHDLHLLQAPAEGGTVANNLRLRLLAVDGNLSFPEGNLRVEGASEATLVLILDTTNDSLGHLEQVLDKTADWEEMRAHHQRQALARLVPDELTLLPRSNGERWDDLPPIERLREIDAEGPELVALAEAFRRYLVLGGIEPVKEESR